MIAYKELMIKVDCISCLDLNCFEGKKKTGKLFLGPLELVLGRIGKRPSPLG